MATVRTARSRNGRCSSGTWRRSASTVAGPAAKDSTIAPALKVRISRQPSRNTTSTTTPTAALSTRARNGTPLDDRVCRDAGNSPLRLTATLSRAVEAEETSPAPNGPTTASMSTRLAATARPIPARRPATGPFEPAMASALQPPSSCSEVIAPTKPTWTSANTAMQISSEAVRAMGTVRCGSRASPARSRAWRNPRKAKTTPPEAIAAMIPRTPSGANPELVNAAPSHWVSSATAAMTGTAILNQVSGVLIRANNRTPNALMTVNTPSSTTATPSPAALSGAWPPPEAPVKSQSKASSLLRYSSSAWVSIGAAVT